MSIELEELIQTVEQMRHEKLQPVSKQIEKIQFFYHELFVMESEEKDKIIIEKLKSRLIKIFYLKLNMKNEAKKLPDTMTPWYERIFRYLFSIVGTALAGISGYSAAATFICVFTTLSNPVTLTCSIMTGLVQALVFIGVDLLDIKFVKMQSPKFKPHMLEYNKQLDNIKSIQKILLTTRAYRKLSSNDFIKAKLFISLLNKDIRAKNAEMIRICEDSPLKKIIKCTFIGMGGLLSAGTGLISGKSLLCLLGASTLAATPISWAVGILLAIFSLAGFAYNQKNSILAMFDKLLLIPKDLKKSQDKFIGQTEMYDQCLDEVIQDKKNDEMQEKAMNDRITALEHKVDELKLLIAQSELEESECLKPTSAPMIKKTIRTSMGNMLFSTSTQLKRMLCLKSTTHHLTSHLSKGI